MTVAAAHALPVAAPQQRTQDRQETQEKTRRLHRGQVRKWVNSTSQVIRGPITVHQIIAVDSLPTSKINRTNNSQTLRSACILRPRVKSRGYARNASNR